MSILPTLNFASTINVDVDPAPAARPPPPRLFLYDQRHARLKWKRAFLLMQERKALEAVERVNMPDQLKRRYVREVVFYSGRTFLGPLAPPEPYVDPPPEDDPPSDSASYGFERLSIARSSPASATSSAEDSATGPTGAISDSEAIDQSPNESDYITVEEVTVSEQDTPEQTRRSDLERDLGSRKLISPTLTRKTNREASDESEAEEAIKEPRVRFFKAGKLFTFQKCQLPFTLIFRDLVEVETFEPLASSTLLVPDNVRPEVQQLAREFAQRFNYRLAACEATKGSFDGRVTHVLVDSDSPEFWKFAQCQAVGCKRYLISAEWLRDSLEERRILPEDPYEFRSKVAETSIARVTRRARLSDEKIFDGFAILMSRPFNDFEEAQMVRLLAMNGARVCDNPKQLIDLVDQARICIIDPRYYRNRNKELLKQMSQKHKFVAVTYHWLYDTYRMYQMQPLLGYLHFGTTEEALKAGVSEELLLEL